MNIKKILALLMALTLVLALLPGASASAEGGVSVNTTRDGDNLIVTLTTNESLNFGGVALTELSGEGLTFVEAAGANGMSCTYGVYGVSFDHTNITLDADTVIGTITFSIDEGFREATQYTISMFVFEAYDAAQRPLSFEESTLTTGYLETEPEYTWATDNSTVTAVIYCRSDKTTTITETVNTVGEVTKQPTCTDKGETTYTATFTNTRFSTQTRTVADVEALDHDWGAPEYTWAEDYSTGTATRRCSRDPDNHFETETVNTSSEVTKQPTCGALGETTYTATFTNPAFGVNTITVADVPMADHEWGEPEYVWAEDYSSVTATIICQNDETHRVTETVEPAYDVVTQPEIATEGLGRYTATFESPLFTTQTRDVTIPRLGYTISVEDYTKSGATVGGLDETYYFGDVTFTVAAAKPVLVTVKTGEDSYAVLTCSTDEGGVHSFTVNVAAETTIALIFKGDTNMDGRVSNRDATMAKQVLMGTVVEGEIVVFTHPLQQMAADKDHDGQLKAREATFISQVVAGTVVNGEICVYEW